MPSAGRSSRVRSPRASSPLSTRRSSNRLPSRSSACRRRWSQLYDKHTRGPGSQSRTLPMMR
eukprot:2658287-Alexandrium_andersonii.AAC.1